MIARNALISNIAKLNIKMTLDKLILTDGEMPYTVDIFLNEHNIGIEIADDRSDFLTDEERLKEAHLLRQNIHIIRFDPKQIGIDPMHCVLHILELAHLWGKL